MCVLLPFSLNLNIPPGDQSLVRMSNRIVISEVGVRHELVMVRLLTVNGCQCNVLIRMQTSACVPIIDSGQGHKPKARTLMAQLTF